MGLDWDKMHREYKERLASEKDPVELRDAAVVKKEKAAARAAHGKHPNSLKNLNYSGRERQYDYDEIIANYKSGKTVPEIVREHGCTEATVYRVLRLNKVELRPYGSDQRAVNGSRRGAAQPKFDKKLIAGLLSAGYSVQATADKVGCSDETVRRVKKSVAPSD